MIRRLSVIAAIFGLLFIMISPPASAGVIRYSVAWETTGSGFTGAKVYRYDRWIRWCPESQSGWQYGQNLWIDKPGGDWLELDTHHSCRTGLHRWIWGIGYDDNFNWLGVDDIGAPGTTHSFSIHRSPGTNVYYFQIDGYNKDSIFWQTSFEQAKAGIESLVDGAAIDKFSNDKLRWMKSTDPGTWYAWSGKDAHSLDAQMCGYWLDSDTWQSGQGDGC